MKHVAFTMMNDRAVVGNPPNALCLEMETGLIRATIEMSARELGVRQRLRELRIRPEPARLGGFVIAKIAPEPIDAAVALEGENVGRDAVEESVVVADDRHAAGIILQVFFEMPYSQRLILHAPPWDSETLEQFVENCLRDRVALVCVVGPDCRRVEDVLDELIVGDGSDDARVDSGFTTTSHPDESLEEVRAFARTWTLGVDPAQDVQEVSLPT